MLLILFHHIDYYGAFQEHTNNAINIVAYNILRSVFMFSVNVFVLISAYFNVKTTGFKTRKLIRLWCEVAFYCLIIYLVTVLFFSEPFQIKEFLTCFLPILFNKYWFFTAYFLLMLIAPFLNKILNNCSKKECIILAVIIFVLGYCALRFPIDEKTVFCDGHNFIWLVCVYLIGGMLGLYPINLKRRYWFIIAFASVVLLVAEKYLYGVLPVWISAYIFNEFWYSYASPFVIVLSVSVFMLFKDIDIKNVKIKKCINFISASTFGIYLFHMSIPFIYRLFFDVLGMQRYYDVSYNVLYVIIYTFILFVMGLAIDLVRRLIFYYSEKGIDKLIINFKTKQKDQAKTTEKQIDEH